MRSRPVSTRAVERLRALSQPAPFGGWVPEHPSGSPPETQSTQPTPSILAKQAGRSTLEADLQSPAVEFTFDNAAPLIGADDAALPTPPSPPRPPSPAADSPAATGREQPQWLLPTAHSKVLLALCLAALALSLMWLWTGRARPVPTPPVTVVAGSPVAGADSLGQNAAPTPTSAASQLSVVVHVAGKVASPGVLTLPAGSRVVDAIDAAGGASGKVDLSQINLARVLVDGEQIRVGLPDLPGGAVGASNSGGSSSGAPSADSLLDLNAATPAQLEELPGVGPVLAGRILAWRTDNGRFASVEELNDVSGIGPKLFSAIKPLVRV